MNTQLQSYQQLQDTGSPWLGRVPRHWALRRTKVLLRQVVDKGHPEAPLLAATQSMGVVRKDRYEKRTVVAQKGLHLLKLVEEKDFVISLRSFEGGIEYAHDRGIISPAYTVLRCVDSSHHAYLALLFKSRPFIDALRLCVTGIREGQNVDYARLSRFDLPLPPPDEQAAIAKFLFHANRRIGRYVGLKRRLISLLEEQKQVVIQRAVTRGLEGNARMRPSGVEWLGGVPEHWKVVPFHAVARRKSVRKCADRELLSVYLHRGVIRFSDIAKKRTNPTSKDLSNYQAVDAGDLVLNNQQAWRGSVGVSEHEGIVSPAYLVFGLAAEMHRGFANYLFRSPAMVRQFVVASRGVGSIQRNIYWPDLRVTRVPVPPPSEQKAIDVYLRRETKELDRLIRNFDREVTLMEEYRTRLAADVVTGQVDVREAAAKLPDLASHDTLADDNFELDEEAFDGDEP